MDQGTSAISSIIVQCQFCQAKGVISTSTHNIINIITHICLSCKCQWYECLLCSHNKNKDPRTHFKFDKPAGYKRHNIKHHPVAAPLIDVHAFTQPLNDEDHDQFSEDITTTFDIQRDVQNPYVGEKIYDENIIKSVDRFWLALSDNAEKADLSVLPNTKYRSFYENQQLNLGAACLINLSQNGVNISAPLIVPREVLLHLRIAELVILLPKTKKRKLASIFEGIENSTSYRHNQAVKTSSTSSNSLTDSVPPVLGFPPTVEEMRNTIIEGENAISPNIPYVPVEALENNHSYSSLMDIVKDLIASGNELDITGLFVQPNQTSVINIGQTRRAQSIYQRSRLLYNGMVLTLTFTFWSDDFEPSNVKQNRNSLWVLTCTISPPKHRTHTSENTYIVAMGPKNASHEVVWRRLQQDLKHLSGSFSGKRPSFYHSGLKKNILVHAEIHCILQDSPERRSCNYVSAGNGQFTALWGRSINLLAIAGVVPSCEKCLSNRINGVPREKCLLCLDWDLISPNILMQFPAPTDYPEAEILENGKLNPRTITYESLCDAASKSHKNVEDGTWKPKNAKAYLSVAGWNGNGKDKIIEHAVNALKWKEAINKRETNNEAYVAMLQCYTQDKAHFEPWAMPSIMAGGSIGMNLFVETPMHILFLNNTRNSVLLIIAWLKVNKKFTPFMKESQGKLEQIQKLSLSFCKALPFGKGTLGGFVSENHMVFARTGKWLFASIESITEEEPYVEPSTPVDCWYVKPLSNWLKARHYPHSGLKAILLARVKKLMNQPGGPPDLLPPMNGQVALVKDLVSSLTSMVAHIMVQITDEAIIQSAERHLKMYLSSYARLERTIREHSKQIIERIPCGSDDTSFIDDINNFDKDDEDPEHNSDTEHNSEHRDILAEVNEVTNTRKKKSKLIPEWIQKHSIIGLTNMISNMREFGSARVLWEGSAKGEGILKEVKPLVQRNTPNFILNAHKKFHQRKGLKYVMSTVETSKNLVNDFLLEVDNIKFYTSDVIKKSLMTKTAISLVRLSDNRFMFITDWKNGEGEVFIRQKYFGQCFGADYFQWKLAAGTQDFNISDITHYCLFLPWYPSMKFSTVANLDPTNEHIYYVITSQWYELVKNGDFVRYRNINLNYK